MVLGPSMLGCCSYSIVWGHIMFGGTLLMSHSLRETQAGDIGLHRRSGVEREGEEGRGRERKGEGGRGPYLCTFMYVVLYIESICVQQHSKYYSQ